MDKLKDLQPKKILTNLIFIFTIYFLGNSQSVYTNNLKLGSDMFFTLLDLILVILNIKEMIEKRGYNNLYNYLYKEGIYDEEFSRLLFIRR